MSSKSIHLFNAFADPSDAVPLPGAKAAEKQVFEIQAHRVIIASRCDWFRRALLSGMKESIDKSVFVSFVNSYKCHFNH
jgi:hypothetical protein